MSKEADKFEDIARRMKELEAERQEALTGSSAPVKGQEAKTEEPSYVYAYAGWKVYGEWPKPEYEWQIDEI